MTPADGSGVPSGWGALLRQSFEQEGLHIVLPLNQETIDKAGVPLVLDHLFPGGRTGFVVGDGGRDFFDRFQRQGTHEGAHPLDRYTEERVSTALDRTFGSARGVYCAVYPFAHQRPFIPIQRLGQAAGLPLPGPLGLQIHPLYGPWWAYRAFVVVAMDEGVEGITGDEFGTVARALEKAAAPCVGCPAPCVSVCPGSAVQPTGFAFDRCATHRAAHASCQFACVARAACIVGPEHRYTDDQLRFHMSASLTQAIRFLETKNRR